MSFKPFYVHKFRQPGKLPNRFPRAFTAFISPNSGDDRKVDMQVTFCAPKDQFSKKQGRSYAAKAPVETFNKRDVPKILSVLAATCNFDGQDWTYTYKYML